MLHREKRQADAHKFDGVFAFEVLRRFVGDAEAEKALAVEYRIGASQDAERD